MGDESFDECVSVAHVGKNHGKIVLGGTEKVGTEHNSQGFSRHLILFFEICHSCGSDGILAPNPDIRTAEPRTCQGAP